MNILTFDIQDTWTDDERRRSKTMLILIYFGMARQTRAA